METRKGCIRTVLAMSVVAVSGCNPIDAHDVAGGGLDRADGEVVAAAETAHRPVYVDSLFPIEEEVRRFRAQAGTGATSLTGGAGSRDALVRLFITALEAEDATALGALALTPAEFIDLYYPHTRFTSRPYEMAPQLVWFQLENYGSKGMTRALNRFGGRPLEFRGYRCQSETEEGPNRISGGCTVDVVDAAGARTRTSLFGQIIERDGHHKFISLSNGL